MKTHNLLLMLAIAMGNGAAHAAQPPADDTAHRQMAMQPAANPVKHEGFGILKGVDAAAGKVEIAHQPIASLGWPGMTMWFVLHGPLPPGIGVGDSVRFELQQGKAGEWVIIRIERK